MFEDPHTGLLCTIRHVCGEYALDDDVNVGVQLDDTDNSTRWIPLSDIEKHSVAGPMYESWKTLQTQYQREIPGGLDLSTEAEFTKAITTGWQPRVPSINLLPCTSCTTARLNVPSSISSTESSAAKICFASCAIRPTNVLNYLYAP